MTKTLILLAALVWGAGNSLISPADIEAGYYYDASINPHAVPALADTAGAAGTVIAALEVLDRPLLEGATDMSSRFDITCPTCCSTAPLGTESTVARAMKVAFVHAHMPVYIAGDGFKWTVKRDAAGLPAVEMVIDVR